jgi:hypothetical protein
LELLAGSLYFKRFELSTLLLLLELLAIKKLAVSVGRGLGKVHCCRSTSFATLDLFPGTLLLHLLLYIRYPAAAPQRLFWLLLAISR